MTEIRTLTGGVEDTASIERAAEIIRAGGLVAFPTETVYGLGANALSPEAVEGIYRAKRRSPNDPCIVHLAGSTDLAQVAELPPTTSQQSQWITILAATFWPGPLSLILPRAAAIPPVVTAGRSTLAVRVPDHPVALQLIRAAGVPIAAPSANTFMHTSPTSAQHVWDDLQGRIDMILDGGTTRVGLESSVLDLTAEVPTLLRPGGVSLERLRAVLGEVARPGSQHTRPIDGGGLLAPGLLTTHYAPNAEVVLIDGPGTAVLDELRDRAAALLANGAVAGALVSDEDAARLRQMLPALRIAQLGSERDLEAVAQRLFAGLRELEAAGVTVILTRQIGGDGLGRAIRDRLTRAAGGRVILVQERDNSR